MTGKVIAIYTPPAKHAEQIAAEAVQVKAGKGIVGDRFFGLRKTQQGRNLTLIEWEMIDDFNQRYRINIPLNATRRNLITQGIRLNGLIGETFYIGNVLCRGVELCEPCKIMARHFPKTKLGHTEIIRAFAGKGGIRAEVLMTGVIQLNDPIVLSSSLL